MSPFLLPLILFLYGEFSKDLSTRYIARILLYSSTLSVIVPMYAPTAELSLIYGAAIFCGGISYCIATCHKRLSKVLLLIPLICTFLNYVSLYLKDYEFLLSIPYYAEYSHMMIREFLVMAVANLTLGLRTSEEDKNLAFIVAGLYVMEYFYI